MPLLALPLLVVVVWTVLGFDVVVAVVFAVLTVFGLVAVLLAGLAAGFLVVLAELVFDLVVLRVSATITSPLYKIILMLIILRNTKKCNKNYAEETS